MDRQETRRAWGVILVGVGLAAGILGVYGFLFLSMMSSMSGRY